MLARELLRAVRQIVGQVDLVGMDVVEVSPPYDHAEITAILAHRVGDGGDQRPRQAAERRIVSGAEGHEQELADNRKLWDAWTAIHTTGDVLRRPAVPRRPDRRADRAVGAGEVGDVAGKTLLHLQCHFGLDTLSWARLGAAQVTGVDFSEPAIAFANELAAETGPRRPGAVRRLERLRPARAARGRDVRRRLHGPRACWAGCPTSGRGPRRSRSFVKPGGIFYIHEGHPVMWAVDDDQTEPNGCTLGYDYWGGETLSFPVEGSYADPEADVDAEVEHGWNHSLGEIVTALAAQGPADRAPRREARARLARRLPARSSTTRATTGSRRTRGHAPADVLAAGPQGRLRRIRRPGAQASSRAGRSLNRDRAQPAGGAPTHAFRRLVDNVERVIAGNNDAVETAAICLFADGNLLLEGVPGRRQDDARARPGASRSAASSAGSRPRPTSCRATSPASASTTSRTASSGSCRGRCSRTSCWSTRSTAPRRGPSRRCSSRWRSARSRSRARPTRCPSPTS